VRNTDDEHRGIVDAVLARNADLAVRLLQEHLWTTARLLIDRDEQHIESAAQLALRAGSR
jgi:DNA-binding GntR family transcriptional regulator